MVSELLRSVVLGLVLVFSVERLVELLETYGGTEELIHYLLFMYTHILTVNC